MPGALFIPVISALIKSRGQAPMRMDKLTSKFQMALADAQSLAVGRDHQFIEPVHLLIALLDQDGGRVRGAGGGGRRRGGAGGGARRRGGRGGASGGGGRAGGGGGGPGGERRR